MTVSDKSTYSASRFVLIYHPEDNQCKKDIEEYKNLLNPEDDTFTAIPLDRLIELWRGLVTEEPDREWIQKLKLRYLDLEASEADYLVYIESESVR